MVLREEMRFSSRPGFLILIAAFLPSALQAAPLRQPHRSPASSEHRATLVENFSASYFGSLFGPSLSAPLSSVRPDPESSGQSAPLLSEHELSLSYFLSDHWSLAATWGWSWEPVRSHGLYPWDPALMLATEREMGRVTAAAALRAALPITRFSRENHLMTSLSLDPRLQLDLGSRWSAAIQGSLTRSFYSAAAEDPGEVSRSSWNFSPELSRRVGRAHTAFFRFELGRVQALPSRDLRLLHTGMVFSLSPRFQISPHLRADLNRGRLGLDDLSLASWVSWSFL